MYGRCRRGIVLRQIFCLEIANTHPQGCTNLKQSEQGRSSPNNCSDTGCFQEMQTVVFNGSPEPCVSNLSFSHECSGVLMFVLKIK